MNNYEIKKGRQGFVKPHTDMADAQAWAAAYNWHDTEAELSIVEIGLVPTPTTEEIVELYDAAGYQIAKELKVELRNNAGKLNPNFKDLIFLLKEGELEDAITEIETIPVGVMPQAMKDKYITNIQSILNS